MSAVCLECKTYLRYPGAFDLDLMWDQAAGTLEGQGAEYIKAIIDGGVVTLHPMPGISHYLSGDPLKSKVDMAAMIGYEHKLPDILADSYPHWWDESKAPVVKILDNDGNVIRTESVTY